MRMRAAARVGRNDMDLRANARVSTRVPLPYLARRLLRPAAEGRYGSPWSLLRAIAADDKLLLAFELELPPVC
jgi:hypothetical protein